MWLNIETEQDNLLINSNENTLTRKSKSVYNEEESQPMNDNTLNRQTKIQKAEKQHRLGPPPSLPAPIPQTNVPTNEIQPEYSQNYSMDGESRALSQGKAAGSTMNFRKTVIKSKRLIK